MDKDCSPYQSPIKLTFILSLFLAIGIFISYLPQHVRIVQRKTTEGLSPMFLLLGSTSGFSSFLNLILVTSQARECCHLVLTKFQCLNSQMGLIQVGVQFISYVLIPILLLIYTRNSITQNKKDYKEMTYIFTIFVIYSIINSIMAMYVIHYQPQDTNYFISYCGIISSILSGVQYFPQIYTTYNLKHAGSLSVSMMWMQTPGGFLWTLMLYLSPNSKWSSWLPYFTAATLQGLLLCMCIYYSFTRDTKQMDILDETAPLL